MRTFRMQLQDAVHDECIEGVESFVGRDASGAFGLMAGHERFMTALVFGLARFRRAGADWEYLATPGALVYFVDGELVISTRRYVSDPDYERISQLLRERIGAEERDLEAVHASLRRLEQSMHERLRALRPGLDRRP